MRDGNKTAIVLAVIFGLLGARPFVEVLLLNFDEPPRSVFSGREIADVLEEVGKSEAEQHILDKYGFEPSIISYYRDYHNYSGEREYEDHCIVTMSRNGKKFYVYVSEENDGIRCSDSYQADRISEAAEELAVQLLPGDAEYEFYMSGHNAESYLSYPGSKSREYGVDSNLYEKLYSGDNLMEVIDGSSLNLNVYLVNTDLSRSELPEQIADWLPNVKLNVTMYSCCTVDQAARMDSQNCLEKRTVTFSYGSVCEESYEKNFS